LRLWGTLPFIRLTLEIVELTCQSNCTHFHLPQLSISHVQSCHSISLTTNRKAIGDTASQPSLRADCFNPAKDGNALILMGIADWKSTHQYDMERGKVFFCYFGFYFLLCVARMEWICEVEEDTRSRWKRVIALWLGLKSSDPFLFWQAKTFISSGIVQKSVSCNVHFSDDCDLSCCIVLSKSQLCPGFAFSVPGSNALEILFFEEDEICIH
jgi:hypothetical protein